MKVNIEFEEEEGYGNPDHVTFSIAITDMELKNRKALGELPDMIKEAYVKFRKLQTNEDIHPVLYEYIS